MTKGFVFRNGTIDYTRTGRTLYLGLGQIL